MSLPPETPYAPPMRPSPPVRPTSVTVIAVIGIVFGILGLCSPLGIMPYVMELPGPPNPMVEMVKESTWMFAWTILSLILAFVFSVVLLTGSIGALQLKPWARTTLIAYSVVSLALGVVSTVVSLVMFMPMTADTENAAAVTQAWTGLGAAGCSLCLGFVIQGAFLYVLTRPDVKRAFGAA